MDTSIMQKNKTNIKFVAFISVYTHGQLCYIRSYVRTYMYERIYIVKRLVATY